MTSREFREPEIIRHASKGRKGKPIVKCAVNQENVRLIFFHGDRGLVPADRYRVRPCWLRATLCLGANDLRSSVECPNGSRVLPQRPAGPRKRLVDLKLGADCIVRVLRQWILQIPVRKKLNSCQMATAREFARRKNLRLGLNFWSIDSNIERRTFGYHEWNRCARIG